MGKSWNTSLNVKSVDLTDLNDQANNELLHLTLKTFYTFSLSFFQEENKFSANGYNSVRK
jgi:hypothetical protein